jgi:hypothetical protein
MKWLLKILRSFGLLALLSYLSLENIECLCQSFSGKTNDIIVNYKNVTSSTLTIVLPSIKWISPKPEYTNSQNNSIEIEADINSDIDIKSVLLTIGDGSSIRASKEITIADPKKIKIKQKIFLEDGQNLLELVAENSKGAKVASSRSILVGKDAIADAVAIDRKDYVLMFATDQYDYWDDLVNPIDDARSLAKILNEKYGFVVEIVENPTVDEVFSKLRDYAERKFKPQDQLMVFFAGHGQFDDVTNEGFVVAKNSLTDDKAKTSYISHNRLRGIIQNLPAEHIFLAMDVCFGGTFDPLIASSRGLESTETSDKEFLVRKLSQRTRKYLTSGGKEYVSDGIPGKHSPFTLRLLQGLSDGGGSDHILTLSELKLYVEKIKPEPRMGSFGDDKPQSDFVFVSKN